MNDINLFFDQSEHSLLIKKNIKLFCKEILHYKKYSNYLISLIFINDEELKKMKHEFLNQDLYTDVIAFNLNDKEEDLDGEIYLSFNRILDNAKLYNTNLETELKRVIAHGVLHLIGYEDHIKSKKEEMTKLEDLFIKLFNHIKLTC